MILLAGGECGAVSEGWGDNFRVKCSLYFPPHKRNAARLSRQRTDVTAGDGTITGRVSGLSSSL